MRRLVASGLGGWRRKSALRAFVLLALTALVGGLLTQPAAATGEQLSAATIAARQHYFGIENVNPVTGAVRNDRVIMSWAGVSTFAASFNGHVVMLDGFIPRGPSTTWNHSLAYVGTTPAEYAALKPEAYFFGHAHSDHLGDLPTLIRANPDVPLYGTQEHCDDIHALVTDVQFTCIPVFPAGAALGTVANLPANVLPGVGITAIKHPHSSGATDPVNDPPFSTMQVVKRPCNAFTQYPTDPSDPPTTAGSLRSGTISIAWQFRVGKFSLVWEDTTGSTRNTGVPAAWASVPPTDVDFGAIAVSARSVLNEELTMIQPKIFLPIHHDPCANDLRKEVVDQLATLPSTIRPTLWYLSDPGDYLRPITFDPSSAAWK